MGSLVSIVTPYRNSRKYFERTYKSVISQTYKDWEWIIVDDNSSKEEKNFLDSLSANKKIKVFHNSDSKGPAYSRNLAISKCSGDFIAFLDSDDIWKDDKLEKQLKFMEENNYRFSATYFDVFDESVNKVNKEVRAPRCCSHKKFLKLDYIGCLTAMYRRDIYPDLAIPEDIKKRNDYALWLKLSERATCFVLPEFLATYVKRQNNSVSSGKKSKLVKYHRDVFIKLYNYSKFKATLCAWRNVLFYILKELSYTKRIKM